MSQKEFQRVKVIENAAVWRFLPQAFHRHRYLGISGLIRRDFCSHADQREARFTT
jgi:hypothetical protein